MGFYSIISLSFVKNLRSQSLCSETFIKKEERNRRNLSQQIITETETSLTCIKNLLDLVQKEVKFSPDLFWHKMIIEGSID